MKPFSAFYFIKENKKKSLLLIFMIFLSFGVYVGGLYITNPYDNWKTLIGYYEKLVSVYQNSGDDEAYRSLLDEAAASGKVTVIELGSYNGMSWESIMGFSSGCSFTFRTVDDFKVFCEKMGITCDFDNLKSGSMIMSEKYAKNKGFSIGDKVDKNKEWNIYGDFTLDAVTKEDGYTLYFISGEEDDGAGALLIGNDIEGPELYNYVYTLHSHLENKSDVWIYGGIEQEIKPQFDIFNIIYMFIAVLLSIILAITINAAFVGMYQRREFEFAVYRAIGISKKQVITKIVKELLLIDAIALSVGAAIVLLGLYLSNHLFLYPVGKYLRYFDPLAFGFLLLCNVIVIVPLIFTRCRQMLRADICEY